MRRLVTAALFALALILTLMVPTAQAANHELIYTVYYTCIIGPQYPSDSVVGEWVRDCDGNLSGWGWTPGTNCTTTMTTPGDACPVE